jgi:hypothetical protein
MTLDHLQKTLDHLRKDPEKAPGCPIAGYMLSNVMNAVYSEDVQGRLRDGHFHRRTELQTITLLYVAVAEVVGHCNKPMAGT